MFRFEKGPDKFPGLFHCSLFMAIATHVCVVLRSVSALFIVPPGAKPCAILLSAFIRLRLSLSSGAALICSSSPAYGKGVTQPFPMVHAQIFLRVLEMVVISEFLPFL